jgi:signal recognition particle GTPase
MNNAKTQAKHGTNGKLSANCKPKLTKLQKKALKHEEERKKQDEYFKNWKETQKRKQEEEEKRAIISAEWYEQNKEMIKQKEDKQRREKWRNNQKLNAFVKKHLILSYVMPKNDEAKQKIFLELNEAIKNNNIHFRVLDRMHKDDKKYIIAIDNYNILKMKLEHFKTFVDKSCIFYEYHNDFYNWYNKYYK